MPGRTVRLFVSSPSDVMAERERLVRVVERIDRAAGDALRLEIVRWEADFFTADQSFQEQIESVAKTDLLVSLFWKRMGTPLDPEKFRRADGSHYESGSEFELEMALAAKRKEGSPDVLVYRKTAPIFLDASDERTLERERQQLEALRAFWRRFFEDEEGHSRAGYQTFEGPDDLEERFEKHLAAWLREKGFLGATAVSWPIDVLGSPFVGLAPFEESHSAVFFGRGRVIESACDRLLAADRLGCPFLLVIGVSGAGKSSLARAGIAPRLMQPGRVPGVDLWRRGVLILGGEARPTALLAQALYATSALPELADGDHPSAEALAGALARYPEGAAEAVRRALGRVGRAAGEEEPGKVPPAARLLLIVDQLEGLFLADEEEQRRLAEALDLLVRQAGVFCVVTVRSSDYEAFQSSAKLHALKEDGAHLDLLPPGSAEIAEIVREPARAAGLVYESDPATGRSLDDVLIEAARGPGALPLLQFTLEELFQQRSPGSNTMTFSVYETLGGLEGAVRTKAERAFAELDPAAQAELRPLLRDLVGYSTEAGRFTLRAAEVERLETGATRGRLAAALRDSRLLVTGAGTATFAHEAVIRAWPRAAEALADEAEFFRSRSRLETAWRDWEEHGRDDAFLLPPGRMTAEARAVRQDAQLGLEGPILDFVDRSLAAEERAQQGKTRRLYVTISVLLVLTLASALAGALAWAAQRQAEASFELALGSADEIALGIADDLSRSFEIPAAEKVTVSELAEDSLRRLMADVDDAPDLELRFARLLTTNARMMYGIGRLDRGLEKAREALAILETQEESGGSSLERRLALAEAEHELGWGLLYSFDLEGAVERLEASLRTAGAEGGGASPALELVAARSEHALGLVASRRLDFDTASRRLAAAGEGFRGLLAAGLGEEHRELLLDAAYGAFYCRLQEVWLADQLAEYDAGRELAAEARAALEAVVEDGLSTRNARWIAAETALDSRLGELESSDGEHAAALGPLRRAIKGRESLVEADPENGQSKVALVDSHVAMTRVEIARREMARARYHLAEASRLYDELGDVKLRWSTAVTTKLLLDWYLTDFAQVSDDHSMALSRAAGSLGRLEALEEAHPRETQLLTNRWWFHFKAALNLGDLRRYQAAAAEMEKTFALTERLAELGADPRWVRGKRTWASYHLAGWLEREDRDEEAAAAYDRCLEDLEWLTRREAGRWNWWDLRRTILANRGLELRNRGEHDAARRRFQEALAAQRRAIELKPDMASLRSSASWVLDRLADLEEKAGNHGAALRHLEAALDLYAMGALPEELEDEDWDDWEAGSSTRRRRLEELRERLAAHDPEGEAAGGEEAAADPGVTPRLLERIDARLARAQREEAQMRERRGEPRREAEDVAPGEVQTVDLTELVLPEASPDPAGGLGSAERWISWSLEPVLPGFWRTLVGEELEEAKALFDPDLKITKLRKLSLPFYEGGVLYEAEHLTADYGPSIAALVAAAGETYHLNGTSPPIHEMNAEIPLSLDGEETVAAYLRFFTGSISGEDGAFRIIDSERDLYWQADEDTRWVARAAVRDEVRPLVIWRGQDGDWRAVASVQYSNWVFHAKFRIPTDGVVEMEDDLPTDQEGLPIGVESFRSGSRVLIDASGSESPWQDDHRDDVADLLARGRALAESDPQAARRCAREAVAIQRSVAAYLPDDDEAAQALAGTRHQAAELLRRAGFEGEAAELAELVEGTDGG